MDEGTKRARRDKSKEEKQWGCSTDLTLYNDPWKIKKKVTESDIGHMSRLLLPKKSVEDLVLPVLGFEAQRDAETEKGTKVLFWDMDTQSEHCLVFKRWASSGSYVFIDNWTKDFVNRRGLKKSDEIGLQWNPYENRFNFKVLVRA